MKHEVKPEYEVLVVDDQPRWRSRLIKLVGEKLKVPQTEGEEQIKIAQAGSVEEAFRLLHRNFFCCALVDQSLITEKEGEDSEGLKVLKEIARLAEGTRYYMITAYGDPDVAFSAGRDLKIEDYISKAKLDETIDAVRMTIHGSIHAAQADYAKRYGNGLAQITATIADAREQAVWEIGVITAIAPRGKAGGGHKELSNLLDHLLKGIPPLIPLQSGKPPQIDKARGVVEAEYWSKALGKPIKILFGRPTDDEISKHLQSPPGTEFVQRAQVGSFAGVVTLTDRDFNGLLN